MEVKKTYYGKINGYDAITCDFIPDDMEVEKEESILYPSEGYLLEKDGETFDSAVIQNENEKNDYKEIEVVNYEEI